MTQSKVNRELADLGTDLTCTNMNEGYATQNKSKDNSPICRACENNMLPLQTIPYDHNEEALAGAATNIEYTSTYY